MAETEAGAKDAGLRAWLLQCAWRGCAVDDPAQWPQALRTLVRLMRGSRLPTLVAWGPQLRLLYNDAFAAVLGPRHPAAFGASLQDVWADAWPRMAPLVERVLQGEACSVQDLPVAGSAPAGARWFTLSFTPAQDDAGRAAGVVAIASETTERVALQRRQVFELLLADELGSLSTPRDIAGEACRLVAQHFRAARAAYVETAADGESVRVLQDWTAGGLPSLAGRTLSAHEFGSKALARLRGGGVLRVNEFGQDPDAPDSGWDAGVACAARAMLAVPLFRRGRLSAVLEVDGSGACAWTDDDVALLTELAERTAAALDAARAEQQRRQAELELHTSAARQAFQLKLADLLRPLTEPQEIVAAASRLLGRHLGVARVLYAEVDDEQGTFRVRSDWTGAGVPSVAGVQRRLDDYGPALIDALRRGQTVAVDDVAADVRTMTHAASFAEAGVRALVLLPLLKAGRLSIVLNLHHAQPRAWGEVDLQRARDMAERTWLALDAASAQAALRAERDQNRYVLDTMAEGFLLLDRHGRIVQINAEGTRLMQVRADEAVGRRPWEVWPCWVEGALAQVLEEVVRTGAPAALEHRRSPAGQQPSAWLDVRMSPALGGGVAVFFRDISQRKRAQEQLQDADRRKDEFLATLAHELRSPLAPIAAAAQMLSLPGLRAADMKRTSEVLGRQVEQMSRLVNELLDISRVTRGVVALQRQLLDVRCLVPQALEQVDPLLTERRHRLVTRLAPQPALVLADGPRLVQVLANLLTNAAKYTPREGRIELALDVAGEEVRIVVRDNGIGMTEQLCTTAFELFTQAERSADRVHGGLGIGLSLVRAIVQLHGGTVRARSDGLGCGSEFIVALPRTPTGPAAS